MLSAIYIKGFKTFARPVRIPLEGGITAIVGPNGSGKSNITDAVLFALGEQSAGVLRSATMSELIFSGSETLPAVSAAEVTLVLDNSSGEISLPYEEVSVTRRISRAGETEYRINGTRARLQDVRAVAGEARIGRHSILRQGAVDAIVAGGPAACRLALEEAAGLGVFRRRRLSASRRLEKAAAQLERSRQLEAELASQLHRIECEAAAAREYRELESRYRELSLAHLYRVATHETGGLRRRHADEESRLAQLAALEEDLRAEERALAQSSHELESGLGEIEGRLEALEDCAEDLRTESVRAERALFHLEAVRGREAERRRSVSRLQAELQRVSGVVESLEERAKGLEAEHAAKSEELARLEGDLARAREVAASAERERARLEASLESLRARLAHTGHFADRGSVLPQHEFVRLAEATVHLEGSSTRGDLGADLQSLREGLEGRHSSIETLAQELRRREGALAAAIGRVEARVRALRVRSPGRAGTRLYDVIRARPGYEVAVEAALGEFGAGVLAENVDEGVRLLSSTERVAIRLDARAVEELPPGKPLVECVEVLDERYAEALERLLGGIYVTEDPERNAPVNGYVAVTREGLRLTRTSVSYRSGANGFARQARLSAELASLDLLEEGPGAALRALRERISGVSSRLEGVSGTVHQLSILAERTSHTRASIIREAARRGKRAKKKCEEFAEYERIAASLTREAQRAEAALAEAAELASRAVEQVDAASSAADAAGIAATTVERRLAKLGAAIAAGRNRQSSVSSALGDALQSPEHETARRIRLAQRAALEAGRLVAATRERRNALRASRSRTADAHRLASAQRTSLAQRATGLARDLATASASIQRLTDELQRAEIAAAEAKEEISAEWGATLEAAHREAELHPPATSAERARLARRLKRFGDVNLLALTQHRALRERYEFVAAQRADAETAANELNRIIRSIDREIEGRFSGTFERVREAFGEMVPRMMEGASGVLDLSEEGVEVGLRLGRRGWKPLRVLSGGERALLALSFLFGIFLSRGGGGTFCVLDEAEAALDDINLARFLAVVDSHRASGQYVLVTHQKRTMAAADVLYGVVQDASGATTIVSKRMQGE